MEMQKQIILPVVLNGNNYLLWSRTTKTALKSRGLWSYVETPEGGDGEETVHEGAVPGGEGIRKQKWEQEDQQVLAVLQSSLEPSILAAYSYTETAKELWETLKGVFGNMSNISRIFEVKKALNDLQQEGKTFKDLFGIYRGLWAELEMLRPPTNDPRELGERREQDQVFGLLLTLNDAYKGLIQHILRFDKLPTLNEVCQQIQKEEGSRSLFSPTSEMAHMAQRNKSYGERRGLECEHCKMKGHTKDKCWTLHPHLKPIRLRRGDQGPRNFAGAASAENDALVKKSDLEALIKGISKLAESGKKFSVPKISDKVIVDSGASHHMISNNKLLTNVEPCKGKVRVANGKEVPIEGIGDLEVFEKNTKALYVPEFTSNLLSVHKTTKDLNCKVIFGPNLVEFQDNETKEVVGTGRVEDGLYLLNKEENNEVKSLAVSLVGTSPLWHSRLGHPSNKVLSMVLPNLTLPNKECEACVLGKQCRKVFPESTTSYKKCFDLVHSDVWTAPCISKDQYKYFVSFIDQKSKYTWVTLMSSKSQVFESFQKFFNYVLNQFGTKIKTLRSDNGGEYMSNQFKKLLDDNGIIHQTSCAYTPQQNGVSERKNRHLLEVARSMMFERGVPKSLWGDAVMTACYVINRLPTENLGNKSPFEVLNGIKPSINHLRVFGCKCYVFIPEAQRNKLEPKSVKCMFVGYSTSQKGYKCFHPETKRMYVSREVRFDENDGYFINKKWEDLEDIACSNMDRVQIQKSILANDIVVDISADRQEGVQDEQEGGNEAHDMESSRDEEESEHEEAEAIQDPEPNLRRSTRIKHGPENWKNTRVYYNGMAKAQQQDIGSEALSTVSEGCPGRTAGCDPDPIGDSISRLSSRQCFNQEENSAKAAIRYPIEAYCSLACFPNDSRDYLSKIDEEQVPTSYEEACRDKRWVQAMEEEIESMERNNTWSRTELPKGKKLIGCRWVYTIKYKSTGEVERYKARLVAKGYTQVYGEDYTETFAPVAKLHSVRVLLSIAVNLSWGLWQMDVKNAFLQGDLEEEVFMAPPEGYGAHTQEVCKLRKAIYGLKQSPRAWYQKLSNCLLEKGFVKSEADHTLFTQKNKEGLVAVLIYVDDIIITGDDVEGIRRTKEGLRSSFDIKDLGELKYFLGIEMTREPKGMFISQRKYVMDLLKETGKLGSKPAKTPIEEGYQDDSKEEMWPDVKQYQRLVGKLIYLTITRPDICFAVNRVSQHMQTPKTHHWSMVERILRYLKGTPGKGIWLECNGHTELEAYCDADWAGDKQDRKSTTGYCTFVGGNLVTWRSKKQKVIALSSAEAEYRAMKEVTKEMIWLKALLKDLGIHETKPMSLYCDNQAAIHIALNPVFHERTKHIEVDCHFIRGKIQDGLITPKFVRSGDQMADIFTKATSLSICKYIHDKIGLWNPYRPILWGSVENGEASSHLQEKEDSNKKKEGTCKEIVEIQKGSCCKWTRKKQTS